MQPVPWRTAATRAIGAYWETRQAQHTGSGRTVPWQRPVDGQACEPGFDVGMHKWDGGAPGFTAGYSGAPAHRWPGPLAETRNTIYPGVNDALS